MATTGSTFSAANPHPRRNQAWRRYQTVRAPNGMRVQLPAGTDPLAWIIKSVYAEAFEKLPSAPMTLTAFDGVMQARGEFLYWGK